MFRRAISIILITLLPLTAASFCAVTSDALAATGESSKPHTTHVTVTRREDERPATCTEEGSYDLVTICKYCGELSRVHYTVPKLDHKPEVLPWEDNYRDATCTEDGGYDTVTVCAECRTELKRVHTVFPKLGHLRVGIPAVPASCVKEGYTEGAYCDRCGEVLAEPKRLSPSGHTPGEIVREDEVAPTCEEDGSYDQVVYCTTCGDVISSIRMKIGKLNHLQATKSGYPPTCTEMGLTPGIYCTRCNQTLIGLEFIPALNHQFITVSGRKPTHFRDGLTDGECCSRCRRWLTEQAVIPKLTGEIKQGDSDGDDEITAMDASFIQRFLSSARNVSEFADFAVDIDGDGEITIIDATLILRFLAGMEIPFPVG